VREYDLIFVIRPDLTDQDIGTVRAEVKTRIETVDGTVEKEDLWGKRQLAYEIKDNTEGVYTLYCVKLPPEGPGKLKEQLKIDERILRYMLTVKIEKPKEVASTPE